ncbi:aminoglycoside phosphotransferase family protein [Ruegeria denitrificans]|nr:aminoglycoside phosphotransferase family protein [Ruegeria denitrificans]
MRHQPVGPVENVECVYRSHGFPDTRLVLKVTTKTTSFALKIDRDSPTTGRLRDEFGLLADLHRHFDNNPSSQVIRPIYLSPTEAFFVTEYIDRPTAVDLIYNSQNEDQVAQVFRRAGSWLHDLHSSQPPLSYAFRPKWMTDSIRELIGAVPRDVADQSRKMVNVMFAEAARLKGTEDLRVFSHGDFHGQNLIVGQGKTIGLDFTESREKLAVYDIVDFLKADIFRPGTVSDVDRSGILKRNKDMFFRLYRHPINHDILDYCIRGRLLKDWLALWRVDHECSPFEEDKRQRLGKRLKIVFQGR